MRAEQLTDPVAYHGEGPVWSPRWGGLRWVDMLADDTLGLTAGGVARRHVGRIAAAQLLQIGGAVAEYENAFVTERMRRGRAHRGSASPSSGMWPHRADPWDPARDQGPPDALPVCRLLHRRRDPDLPRPAHRGQAQIVTELHDADQLATISSNEEATEIDPTTVRAMTSGPDMANSTDGRGPGMRTDRGPDGVPRGDPGLPPGEHSSPARRGDRAGGACPAAVT
jgi:hypothetical protein